MAIARGAGTEIIRTAMFEDIDDTVQKLIIGEQHHIYTVLSIVITCIALQAAGNQLQINLTGYDSKAGTSAQDHKVFRWQPPVTANDTFVWTDKFSFNGFEPVDFAGPLDDVTKQNAIADQGSSVSQYLALLTDSSSTKYDLVLTYIDQNNA